MEVGLKPGYLRQGLLLVVCLATGVLAGCSHKQDKPSTSWDPRLAAAYLDQREVTWMDWPLAARDHGTFCVSCHTNVAYALSRPVLRKALSEESLTVGERKLLNDVTKRVSLWNEVAPFYSDEEYKDSGKAVQSRGTEAVLNALILATYDAPNGHLSDTTRAAFNNMWALQQTQANEKGAWRWLEFGMEPWEAPDSPYYGACLAAIAVGTAPENYRSAPEIQDKVGMLREYLNRESAKQSTINRVVLLWASAKLPGLLEAERQKTIVKEVMNEQQSDGGWNLSALAYPGGWSLHSLLREWLRSDGSTQDRRSDGYATGLITLALQQAGTPVDDPRLRRGLAWLARNQNRPEGSWPSLSLAQRRNPSSITGHFMRDAATAYAVLALSESQPTAESATSASNH